MSTVKLLDAVTVTGPSERWKANAKDHTVQVNITGAPTAVVVTLQGSLDGNTFFEMKEHTLAAGELTAQAAMFHVTDELVKWVRVSMKSVTGGTSPTATVRYTGKRLY